MMKVNGFKRGVMTVVVVSALFAMCALPVHGVQENSVRHLRGQGTATQLVVDGKPFLILGGELGNSTSSSLEYMRAVWPKVVALNLNTLLVPVYWELIEPEEGKFDFNLVDGLIQEAGRHQLRLVPLWFASWTYERPASSITQNTQTPDAISGGLVISVAPDEFVFAGTGLIVTFEKSLPDDMNVGILSAQGGNYVNGQWALAERRSDASGSPPAISAGQIRHPARQALSLPLMIRTMRR
jgi:hypothetical protein